MWTRLSSFGGALIGVQLALIFIGMAVLYGHPPISGRILLIPMTHDARARLVSVAVDHGARLVASGRLPGSVVVDGRRDQLALPLLRQGILALRAFSGACGDPVGGQA